MNREPTLQETQSTIKSILQDTANTQQQIVYKLAKTAENLMPYPKGTPDEFYELVENFEICDLSEGHAQYTPRYILPDYQKFLAEGSKFLRLGPATNLYEATNNLLMFYRHVPSVTTYPVFMGHIDQLLEPFVTGSEQDRDIIRGFLIHCDRTFGSSFCHMNLGPRATQAGRIILELEAQLQNSVPNMTLLYDPAVTPDDFAQLAIQTSLVSANPAFAHHPTYMADFGSDRYGIASCYNGLPLAGGAFTLSRIRLNRIAEHAQSLEDFLQNKLPHTVDTLCRFMEAKIRYLVEETPYFQHHFLVTEGFIHLDNFVGLFGMVGLCECVNVLMEKQGEEGAFGTSDKANQLGVAVLERLKELVDGFQSKYGAVWNHRFVLHAQVGAENDLGISPGARIAIGSEVELYDHLRQAGLYHRFFPSGVGDIFPFDTTAKRNPQAILDVFKGAFEVGMRYISTYASDSDLIRVTGYLVKKSEVEAYARGEASINETVGGSLEALQKKRTLERKVRSL